MAKFKILVRKSHIEEVVVEASDEEEAEIVYFESDTESEFIKDLDEEIVLIEPVGGSEQEAIAVPACSNCGHQCPVTSLCPKCGGDPMVAGDTLCVDCDRKALASEPEDA